MPVTHHIDLSGPSGQPVPPSSPYSQDAWGYVNMDTFGSAAFEYADDGVLVEAASHRPGVYFENNTWSFGDPRKIPIYGGGMRFRYIQGEVWVYPLDEGGTPFFNSIFSFNWNDPGLADGPGVSPGDIVEFDWKFDSGVASMKVNGSTVLTSVTPGVGNQEVGFFVNPAYSAPNGNAAVGYAYAMPAGKVVLQDMWYYPVILSGEASGQRTHFAPAKRR